MSQASQTFLIVWPPSVNSIWRAVYGRNILSARYRKWREAAAKELMVQRPKKIGGPVSVTIELRPPNKINFDLDNRIKPILDLLVHCGVLEDDSWKIVKRICVELGSGFDGARVTIDEFQYTLTDKPGEPA